MSTCFLDVDQVQCDGLIADGKGFNYYGMERSGHHAMLNWIHGHIPGPTFHIGRFNHRLRQARWFSNPGEATFMSASFGREVHLGEPENNIKTLPNVVVVRDIRNMWASRIQMAGGSDHPIVDDSAFHIWQEYADQAMSVRDYFKQTTICLLFDRWFEDIEYRKSFLKRFSDMTYQDLEFTDATINEVSRFGGGSSFDKMHYKNRAQEMSVTKRWHQVEDLHIPKWLLKLNEKLIAGI